MTTPRLFRLERDTDPTGVSGPGHVADGVIWPDGTVTLRWRGQYASTVCWDTLGDARAVHGHVGATRFVFDDEPTTKQETHPLPSHCEITLNAAYRERAHLVALLAAAHPSEMHENPDAEYEDWPIVMVTTPAGQMAWHLSPDDTELFPHVKYAATVEWDGHTTDEKYARMRHLTAQTAAAVKYGAENAQALKPMRDAVRRFTDASGSTS